MRKIYDCFTFFNKLDLFVMFYEPGFNNNERTIQL